ncbi:MAG TPA: serine hydrolase domain-containing protein [Thermoanaerobaculia bacterium]|jgi:CubicO group peptidase (beta-lactamase class C family)|nr:serine hydrolase domain-containing protein [Thermoanaerobaculia bacterium]
MRWFPVLIATLVTACATQPAVDHKVPTRHQQIDALFQPWDSRTTPGCAVAVSLSGSLDYARGYGIADLENDIPITPRSIFPAASISKQFTAFSVGLLVQDGKLSLEDDIRKYVPEIPDYGRTITIDHLIHHTSGLREQGQLLNLSGWRGGDPSTEDDILQVLSRQRRLSFEPGSEIVYTNVAYTLLGLIVRRVSGQSLKAFAEDRIFKPLDMVDTHFGDDRTAVVPRRAPGYSLRAAGGWSVNVATSSDHYGAGGLFTTVGDLLKWEQNLIDGRVGSPALIAWTQTSGKLNDGTETGYGAGLILRDYRGLRTVSHDGLDGGTRTEAVLFPDQRLAIVALCNSSTVEPTSLTRKVADLYLSDQMRGPALAPIVEASDAEQSVWAGVYWNPSTDEVVQIEWKDGALRQVGSATPFVPIGDGVFRPNDLAHEWRFVRSAADGQPELRIRDAWRTQRVFTRVSLPLPDVAALNAFVGQYHSEETEMTYTARVSDGRLRLSWPRQQDFALDPIGGDRFVSSRGTVTFIRTASGDVAGFTISHRRMRRLFAERVSSVSR